MSLVVAKYRDIETKVKRGTRLSREDGLALIECNDLAWLGYLADIVRKRKSGDYVYFNVNKHINLTNVCVSRCKFCAFGCDADSPAAYSMTKETVRNLALQAAKDKDLRELHIVSGLHPTWDFEHYVDIIKMLKVELPYIHLKAFTAIEIWYFSQISGKSVAQVLGILKEAGLDSMPGGGAEILSDRVRKEVCPNKANSKQWLEVIKTAHIMGIKTNATMLYGHIETNEERIDHLLALRSLQDETRGFQVFIPLPFHPANTSLAAKVKRAPVWEDLKMIAVSRLMLDNFDNIKAYWIMLTLPIAQLALAYGANDIDGTVNEERITHAAGAKSETALDKQTLISAIRTIGRIPVERDSVYNIIKVL